MQLINLIRLSVKDFQKKIKESDMWYVELNGRVLTSQPFQRFSDCFAECKRLQSQMCAVMTRLVYESEI